MHSFELLLNQYLWKKAPKLPLQARQFFVKVAPFGAIFMVIGNVIGILAVIGISAWSIPLLMGIGSQHVTSTTMLSIVVILFGVTEGLLHFFAIPGLFARKYSGWKWLFYALIVSTVFEVLLVNFWNILFEVISLYFLFQIRSIYLGKEEEQIQINTAVENQQNSIQ